MSAAVVLLAAGLSRRFGGEDKLAVPLDGIPLGLRAARTLSDLPFYRRIVVTGRNPIDWPGFTIVTNDEPEAGMGRSLSLGVRAAREVGASAVLVALADMPFVSARHYANVLACHQGPDSVAASSEGSRRMPPALFGSSWFGTLESLTGDAGAKSLLDSAQLVISSPGELADIDDPADLRAAKRALASRNRPAP